MRAVAVLEQIIRRDRVLMSFGLAALTALAWIYLVRAAASMNAMTVEAQMHAAMGMGDMRVWGLADWFGLFVMWAVMMVAMMLPSAAPVMLLVLGVYRHRGEIQSGAASVAFVAGYLFVWAGFSLAASTIQLGLHRAALLAPDMSLGSSKLSGALLLIAGLYQVLPLKNACLMHCQSPLGFLMQHWSEGTGGGFRMGVRHGTFCVGCCWMLMALLFVVGVMNLLWVAALSVFVLIEKLARQGVIVGRLAGVAAMVWGVALWLGPRP
jgi:predicted metal-binding membrane protein